MLILGTRGSKLALTQTSWVRDQIQRRFPDARPEIKIIKTTADRDQLMPLRSASLRGVFIKEIEEALIAGEIDLAVHSAKDMPTKLPDPLEISAIPEREDPRDALLSALLEAANASRAAVRMRSRLVRASFLDGLWFAGGVMVGPFGIMGRSCKAEGSPVRWVP